jgi:hypothetical protein
MQTGFNKKTGWMACILNEKYDFNICQPLNL